MRQMASCHKHIILRWATTVYMVAMRCSSNCPQLQGSMTMVKLYAAQMPLQLLLGFCRSVLNCCLLHWLVVVYSRLLFKHVLLCIVAEARLHAVSHGMTCHCLLTSDVDFCKVIE